MRKYARGHRIVIIPVVTIYRHTTFRCVLLPACCDTDSIRIYVRLHVVAEETCYHIHSVSSFAACRFAPSN